MSKIGNYVLEQMENGKDLEQLIEEGFENEDSEHQR